MSTRFQKRYKTRIMSHGYYTVRFRREVGRRCFRFVRFKRTIYYKDRKIVQNTRLAEMLKTTVLFTDVVM